MMRELERFDEWASAARRQDPPRVDITPRVVRTIERFQPKAAVERPVVALAATAVIAASIALVAAWQSWQIAHDPVIQWLKPPNYLTMR
jgi:hypothetical protein